MKNYYNINYSLLVMLLTPTILRSPIVTTLLTSLAKPLDQLNDQFNGYTQGIETSINAQVCYMQAIINDEFDFIQRRVKIRTSDINTESYLSWVEIQDKPIMLSAEESEEFTPYIICRDGLIGVNNPDFDIVFPIGYTLSTAEMRKLRLLINKNKLASKKYRIVYE
ncbi:MAG: hypothetical protein ACK5JU_07935 [Bacteroidales bacterium]